MAPFFPVQDEHSHLKIYSLLCVCDVSVGVSMPDVENGGQRMWVPGKELRD